VPLFLDRHDAAGATAQDIAAAHELDLAVQDRYGVRYVTYWFDDAEGTVFCLAEGRDRDAVEAVHRDAHGLMAVNVIEVGQGPINAFLGDIPRYAPGHVYTESAVRAILFTDVCESTRLTQELGDTGFMTLLREHDETVRAALSKHGGREVKHTGDGIMASFSSVAAAIEAAISIQGRMVERNATASTPMCLRIGVSAGEPVTERDDLFGAAVQLSARLCDIAPPGGIAVSTAVRELCVGKPFGFDCRGEVSLKGFAQPVSVFEVRLPDA
ncbi:MAG TPA: nickel-binding protein, partial [Acidimicrobiales bacterium]|nr:nickel-binding protein [Acidimicrobiales bacterium]